MASPEEDLRDIFTDQESESEYEFYDDDWEGVSSSASRVPRDSRPEKIPDDVRELLSQAQQSFGHGHNADAIKLCEEAIKIDPSVRQTYNLMVSIYEDEGDEEKALVAKFHAATLNKSDLNDWMDLVDRAIELGKYKDAAVALQQVSNIKPDDWELRWRRAKVHGTLGQHHKALSVLNRLRARHFAQIDEGSKVLIIKDISSTLQQLGRLQDAIDMYKKIYTDNIYPEVDSDGNPIEPEVLFETVGIEEYARLLQKQKLWRQAILVVKHGVRYMMGRLHETYWNDDNDLEFDDQRRLSIDPQSAGISSDPGDYEIPLEFRVILLECRLHQYMDTGNTSYLEDANSQIPVLEEEAKLQPGSYQVRRCMWSAADAFFSAKEYATARKFYDDLGAEKMEPTQEEYTRSMIQVAKCFNLLKSPENAIVLYEAALQEDPDNIHALIGLAESYQEVGQKERSKRIVQRAVNLRAKELDIGPGYTINPQEIETVDETTDPALFAADQQTSGKKVDAAARARFEQSQSELADAAFLELDRFQEGLMGGNEVAAHEWIRSATVLIQIFRSNKKFFPSDRNKQFIASTSAAANANLNIDERLDLSRVAAADDDGDDDENSFRFKGKTFDTWFEIFMRTALARAWYDKVESAYMIIRTGKMSNVFHNDARRELTMDLVQLACAYHVKDFVTVSEVVRHLYSKDQFNDEILLMYNALLPSSQGAVEVFGSANNQKFFLRNIKAMDAAVGHKEVKGAAKLKNGDGVHDSPILRLLYAQIMLMGPSYTPALTYLLAALHSLPNDPMVLLTLSVVCMQRALQRVTPNRHLQILQGLSFIQDYMSVRVRTEGEQQEANYNMGRFYHGLGLFSLAVPFYEKVFEFNVQARYDLSKEAAYNLHLIYAISGNMRLARKIIDDSLEI